MGKKHYVIPEPVLDGTEQKSLTVLNERYNKLIEPSKLAILGKSITDKVPVLFKKKGESVKKSISEQEIFQQAMKIVEEGFKTVEEQAAKFSLNENKLIEKVNQVVGGNQISDIREFCLARSYDLTKLVESYKNQDKWLAFIEGAATSAVGFVGVPFNIVVSTFLYYRAIQSVAMHYGYDVKHDAGELIIAGEVFLNALSPANSASNEMGSMIGKIMIIAETECVKQTAKKTWTDMAAKGGASLLLTQMRALAHKSAQKALENVGAKGLEKSIYKRVLEQIGQKLTLKTIQKGVPIFSGAVGGFFDIAQMKKILEYADIFYNKRFIIEKEQRINLLNKRDSY